MQKPPRKHHFVPRSLLRFFSIDGAGDQVHVFDKIRGKVFTASLMDAASENNFNRLQTSDGFVNFESMFDDVDGKLAQLCKAVHGARKIVDLTSDDRTAWADMVAVQLVRTPLFRSTLENLTASLLEQVERAGFAAPINVDPIGDNDARRLSIEMFSERDRFREFISRKEMVLFEAPGSRQFLTSDHPIVMRNTTPYGDIGLDARGIAIFFPIGHDLALGFLCPSIGQSLVDAKLESSPHPLPRKVRLIQLRDGIRSGLPVPWSDSDIDGLNAMEILESARFIYSRSGDFSQAQRLLDAQPHRRRVTSMIEVGQLGSGPPPSPDMPLGNWLIILGHRHDHMIELSEVRDGPFEVSTRDLIAARAAAQDMPIGEARLYSDRHQLRSKRRIRLEIHEESEVAHIKVKHADPALDAFDTWSRGGDSKSEDS